GVAVEEEDGVAEALEEGRYSLYSGSVPSTTGTLIVAESEPLRMVTGLSPPGLVPAVLRTAASASSFRYVSELALTGISVWAPFAPLMVRVASELDLLNTAPITRPGWFSPVATISMLRSCSWPRSALTPSDAEYWWEVCWALTKPQPVTDRRPTPIAAAAIASLPRWTGFIAVMRTTPTPQESLETFQAIAYRQSG